jgi:GNAT superfamily N-acetyltransferase
MIRRFERGDVDFAVRQKLREGWAVNRERFEVYLAHDPDGCFVALDGERPVGMVTTSCFGESAWIGNLIVEPGFRSRGIGRALMEHGLESLRTRGAATIRLEGDPDGIPLYRKLGFVDEFDSCRFALAASSGRRAAGGSPVETMRAGELGEAAALDAEIFGANRRRFLELVLACAELALVRRRDEKIAAYLLAVPTDRGLRLGPCVARSEADARTLVSAAISAAGDRPVLVGVPAPNVDALRMLAGMGFDSTPPSLRMRLGPPVAAGDPGRVFAISSGAAG